MACGSGSRASAVCSRSAPIRVWLTSTTEASATTAAPPQQTIRRKSAQIEVPPHQREQRGHFDLLQYLVDVDGHAFRSVPRIIENISRIRPA
jgi:hypothetical protein